MSDSIEDFTLVLDPEVDEALATVDLRFFLHKSIDSSIRRSFRCSRLRSRRIYQWTSIRWYSFCILIRIVSWWRSHVQIKYLFWRTQRADFHFRRANLTNSIVVYIVYNKTRWESNLKSVVLWKTMWRKPSRQLVIYLQL